MNTVPYGIILLHSFIAGFLMSWLGLLLINIRPKFSKLFIAALCYAVYVLLIRNLNISLPATFVIQIVLLIMIIMFVWNLSPLKSLVATIFGTLVLATGEAVSLPVIMQITGFTIEEIMNNRIIMLLMPLPQVTVTLTLIFLCLKFNIYLFDFKDVKKEHFETVKIRRTQTIVGIVLTLLCVITIQLIFNMSVINQSLTMFRSVPLTTLGIISSNMLIVGLLTMVFLIRQLIDLTKKENQYHKQSEFMETVDELYTAIRSERHDIINHLQTIYGFSQLGYLHEVRNYLSELLGGDVLSSELIITGTPGLTALFYIKSGMARTNGIRFNVKVDENIDELKITPYELNTILGNLINNAFDAVMQFDSSQRVVNVYVGNDGSNYVLKVANYGTINDSVKKKIFEKGYSTKKDGHSGLGLYIINSLIKKYGGSMELENEDYMVEFSVFFPINIEKGELHEFAGQKASSFTG